MCVADDVLVLSSAGPIVGLYQSLGSTLSMRTLVIPGDSSISCSVSQSVSHPTTFAMEETSRHADDQRASAAALVARQASPASFPAAAWISSSTCELQSIHCKCLSSSLQIALVIPL